MRLGDQAHRGALLTTSPGPTHHARPMRVKQEATAGDRSPHAKRAHCLVGRWLAPAGRGRPFFDPLSVGRGPR